MQRTEQICESSEQEIKVLRFPSLIVLYIVSFSMEEEGLDNTFDNTVASKSSLVEKSIFDTSIVLTIVLLILCSSVYIRRVPKINKILVGEGGPLRLIATLSGQFDFILSIACFILAFYVLFLY